jgi:hypothetical protein
MRFTKKQRDHAVYERTLALQAQLGDKKKECDGLWKERPEIRRESFRSGFVWGGRGDDCPGDGSRVAELVRWPVRPDMKTHYARRPGKPLMGDRLTSPVESVIVTALPTDRLVTMDELFPRLQQDCRREGVSCPNPSGVTNLLEDLAKRGFVYEVYGVRLDRFLSTL